MRVRCLPLYTYFHSSRRVNFIHNVSPSIHIHPRPRTRGHRRVPLHPRIPRQRQLPHHLTTPTRMPHRHTPAPLARPTLDQGHIQRARSRHQLTLTAIPQVQVDVLPLTLIIPKTHRPGRLLRRERPIRIHRRHRELIRQRLHHHRLTRHRRSHTRRHHISRPIHLPNRRHPHRLIPRHHRPARIRHRPTRQCHHQHKRHQQTDRPHHPTPKTRTTHHPRHTRHRTPLSRPAPAQRSRGQPKNTPAHRQEALRTVTSWSRS